MEAIDKAIGSGAVKVSCISVSLRCNRKVSASISIIMLSEPLLLLSHSVVVFLAAAIAVTFLQRRDGLQASTQPRIIAIIIAFIATKQKL